MLIGLIDIYSAILLSLSQQSTSLTQRMNLTKIRQAASHLKTHGYAIIPKFIPLDKAKQAIAYIDVLLKNFDIEKSRGSVFDASQPEDQRNKLGDYFLNSVYQNGFFFESGAWQNGQLVVPKEQSINKIGHCMHEQYEIFKDITYADGAWQICQQLGIKSPQVFESMAVLKPPKIGSEVRAHQDTTFLCTQPDTLLGWWVPLEDSTLQNSCLWGIPGSHKLKLAQRWDIDDDGRHKYITLNTIQFKDEDFVPLEMEAGSLVIFTGTFVHRSYPNTSNRSRYAYTWHLHDASRSTLHPKMYIKRRNFIDFPEQYRNRITI